MPDEGKKYVPRVGDASEEATPAAAAPTPEPEKDPAGLCQRCNHQEVCAVSAAIRVIGGEGRILVSECPGFQGIGEGFEIEPDGG